MQCWQCGAAVPLAAAERVSSRATCARCDADLHACRGCRHYDPKVHHECSEPMADWVKLKDRNNYCDYFSPAESGGPAAADQGSAARDQFDRLFGR